MEYKYFIANKPFNTLCQFSGSEGKSTLKDFFNFDKDVYPLGRLDYDSEGLLIFTNDNYLKTQLLNPENERNKTYLVQVEGEMTESAILELKNGVIINVNGNQYKTKPAKAELINNLLEIPERVPPIRFRKNINTSWLKITITEGKNRQIRKMAAKVGFPTLRLIRISIEGIELGNLKPGEVKMMSRKKIYEKLKM